MIVTQEDPFYIPHFFRSLCRVLSSNTHGIVIREVIIQPAFGEKKLQLVKRMLGFYGWVDFLRLLGRYVGQTGLSLLEELKLSKQPVSIAGICREQRIPVRIEADVNSAAFIEHVRNAGIDLIVSVSAAQIFKHPLLQTPPRGCINIHNGRLPDYRGMLPNFWQMLNGEAHSTTTIHTMVKKLDAGAVLWEEKTPIRPCMTLDALIRETKEKSAEALWQVLEVFARGERPTVLREIAGEGTYYSFPSSGHANALRRRGHALL